MKKVNNMNIKDLFIRFLLGGTAVSLSYLITIISPWKILAGIFAAFPAVMLTAVIMVGIASGTKKATNIARGSVYGMIGGIICVTTVLITLESTDNWVFSIVLGLLLWLGSSLAIATLRERAARKVINHV
jgi:threonine/homoserine/homoserine lactone efflux protein